MSDELEKAGLRFLRAGNTAKLMLNDEVIIEKTGNSISINTKCQTVDEIVLRDIKSILGNFVDLYNASKELDD